VDHFDLAIIGTGSGNSLVTPDFDDKRVAVVESGAFGGTCLNVGCIPTKMFVYAAEVATTIREASRYGVDARLDGVRWRDIRDRVFGRIDPISEGGRDYRIQGPNTTAFLGHARFVGERRLSVDLNSGGTAEFTADQVVIATGARPVLPPAIADAARAGAHVHTSDTIMRVDELPERLVVVGGGYIACEFAHVFSALGTEVVQVVRGTGLLTALDGDVSRRFSSLQDRAWQVRYGVNVVSATPSAKGKELVDVTLDDGTALPGVTLLAATGRRPNTDALGLEEAGVEVHPDGRVRVDEYGRTTADGVWSLGDASSEHQLKHVANHEARAVAHNLAHPDDLRAFDHRFVPAAVFTRPQIASVGETEEQLRARGARYVSKVQAFGDVAYGWAMEDRTGFCKVLADPTDGTLLGAHIMGHEASMLVQPLVQAMATGLTAHQMARGQYWIHPALTEVVENALLGLPLDDGA